jgi:DNA repair ATPase RecN
MANQARVSSTAALESLRASLIVFLGKARRSVDGVGDEVRRTRQWLQHDQRLLWEGERRRRIRLLEQAEQELASVRLSGDAETALLARRAAVNKAQRAVNEAEDKLRTLKAWNQNYDHHADPIVKRLESLRSVLDHDIPLAIAYLVNAQKTLEAYSDSSTPPREAAPAPPAETETRP